MNRKPRRDGDRLIEPTPKFLTPRLSASAGVTLPERRPPRWRYPVPEACICGCKEERTPLASTKKNRTPLVQG